MSDPLSAAAQSEAEQQQQARAGISGADVAGVGAWDQVLQTILPIVEAARGAAGLSAAGGLADLTFDFSGLPDPAAEEDDEATGTDLMTGWIRRLSQDPTGLVMAQQRLFALGYYPQ